MCCAALQAAAAELNFSAAEYPGACQLFGPDLAAFLLQLACVPVLFFSLLPAGWPARPLRVTAVRRPLPSCAQACRMHTCGWHPCALPACGVRAGSPRAGSKTAAAASGGGKRGRRGSGVRSRKATCRRRWCVACLPARLPAGLCALADHAPAQACHCGPRPCTHCRLCVQAALRKKRAEQPSKTMVQHALADKRRLDPLWTPPQRACGVCPACRQVRRRLLGGQG